MITEKCSLPIGTKETEQQSQQRKALAAAAGGICGNSFKTVGKAPGANLMKLCAGLLSKQKDATMKNLKC